MLATSLMVVLTRAPNSEISLQIYLWMKQRDIWDCLPYRRSKVDWDKYERD